MTEKYNSEMAGKPGFEAVDTQGQSIEVSQRGGCG